MNHLLKYLFESIQTEEDVQQIKQKILDLSIQGKLVPQKEEEPSAQNLLASIRNISSFGQNLGKKHSNNNFNLLNEEDKVFQIPEKWSWCNLGEVIEIGSSRRVKQSQWKKQGIPFYRAREIVHLSKYGYVNNELFISKEHFLELKKHLGVPKENDLMVTGVGTIGVSYIVKADDEFYFKDASVLWFKNINNINPKFIKFFMHSNIMKNYISKNAMGTTVNTLTIKRANNLPFPLPSQEEQHRIVNEVEKLFSICEGLAERIREKKEASAILNKTVFTSIQSESSKKADQALQFAINHMDELLQSPEDIDLIKEAVLSLATRGKLVLQNFEEEPAFKLLDHIEEEKKYLISNKKMKKQTTKDLSDCYYKKEYLPKGWEVIRAGKIIQLLSGRDLSTTDCNDKGMGIPYIMGASNIDMKKNELLIERWVENPTVIGKKGDLLLSVKGTVGKLIIQELEEAHLSRQIMGIRAIGDTNIDYLKIYFEAHIKSIRQHSQGLIPGISREHILNTIIYLPPLEEQERIVNKVQSLFQLFDNLKEQLLKKQNAQKILNSPIVKLS